MWKKNLSIFGPKWSGKWSEFLEKSGKIQGKKFQDKSGNSEKGSLVDSSRKRVGICLDRRGRYLALRNFSWRPCNPEISCVQGTRDGNSGEAMSPTDTFYLQTQRRGTGFCCRTRRCTYGPSRSFTWASCCSAPGTCATVNPGTCLPGSSSSTTWVASFCRST